MVTQVIGFTKSIIPNLAVNLTSKISKGIKMEGGNFQIKLSKTVAASKLQSLHEDRVCLSEPCQSVETKPETEMKDTTCGAVDVYDSNEAFKIVKQKIKEEKNTGEDLEKSDETTVAISYRYPDPGQTGTTSSKKVGTTLLVTLLILQCFPYAGGNSFDNAKQGQQEDYCGTFQAHLRNVAGPFRTWSMCEIRRQSIQCPMEYIGRCFPFVENNAEYYLSCIFNSTSLSVLLNDGQCILVTTTKGSNDFLAQCYKKDDCIPGNITSPKPATTNFPNVTMGSTKDSSTPNATNPLPDSLKKSMEPSGRFNWTSFIIVLFVAVVCIAIVLFVRYIVPLCIGRFWIRHCIHNHVRSCC